MTFKVEKVEGEVGFNFRGCASNLRKSPLTLLGLIGERDYLETWLRTLHRIKWGGSTIHEANVVETYLLHEAVIRQGGS